MTPSVPAQLHWSTTDVARMLISNNALASVKTRDAVVLAQRMRLCRVASGAVLFKAGDTNTDFMAFVLEGEAVVESTDAGAGDAMVLHVLTVGQMVGEMGVVANAPRSATVTAATDMLVAVLDQTAFALLIKQAPDVACGFLSTLLQSTSDRLRESNRKLLTLTRINQSLFAELVEPKQDDGKLADFFVSATNFKAVQSVGVPPSKPISRHPSQMRPPSLGRFKAARA
jgi:CRP/FNR family transcriptional regulator, cyclic AMP receptor protein